MADVDQKIREGLERLAVPEPVDRARVFQDLVARRRRRHRRRAAAAVVVPAVTLAGVIAVGVSALDLGADDRSDVATSEGSEPRSGADDDGGGPLIVAFGDPPMEQARFGGYLVQGDDGCLFLGGEPASPAVMWPSGTRCSPGTSSSEEDGVVVTPDGTTIGVGEWFEASGGTRDAGSLGGGQLSDDDRQRLTACAEESGGQVVFLQGGFRVGDPDEEPSARLSGRTFSGDIVTDAEAPRPLVQGTAITIAFDAPSETGTQTITWHAGCNTMSASLAEADGRLQVAALVSSTYRNCSAERAEQDRWLSDLLKAEPSWTLDGDTLTLVSENTIITLTAQG